MKRKESQGAAEDIKQSELTGSSELIHTGHVKIKVQVEDWKLTAFVVACYRIHATRQ